MMNAAALLADESTTWITLERESARHGPVVLRVQIRRVSMALTMAHGCAQALLLAAAQQGLQGDGAARKLARLEEAHVAAGRELEARAAALDTLPPESRAAAEEQIRECRRRLVEGAQAIADARTAQMQRVVQELVRRDPGRSAEQHAAVACGGVIGLGVVTVTTPKAPARVLAPDGPVQLVTTREEADPALGRYFICDVFSRDETFAISEAVYDHSSGGAGGRRTLAAFRRAGADHSGTPVGDVGAPEPAGPRADPAAPVGVDPDVPVPGGVRDPETAAGPRAGGHAGAASDVT